MIIDDSSSLSHSCCQVLRFLYVCRSVVIGLFLILWREEYCSIASNYNECHAVSIVYGFTNLCCGVVFHVFLFEECLYIGFISCRCVLLLSPLSYSRFSHF